MFIHGYPAALQSILDGQAVQVVFFLGYQPPEGPDDTLYLTTFPISVATV